MCALAVHTPLVKPHHPPPHHPTPPSHPSSPPLHPSTPTLTAPFVLLHSPIHTHTHAPLSTYPLPRIEDNVDDTHENVTRTRDYLLGASFLSFVLSAACLSVCRCGGGGGGDAVMHVYIVDFWGGSGRCALHRRCPSAPSLPSHSSPPLPTPSLHTINPTTINKHTPGVYNRLSSNGPLMVKSFMVLIAFIVFFVIFVA